MKRVFAFLIFIFCVSQVYAQSEVMAWGNITAIRVNGEPMEFESNIGLQIGKGDEFLQTAKERQRPRYDRDGAMQKITTRVDFLRIEEIIEDIEPGLISINLKMESQKDTSIVGAYFCLDLPVADYRNGLAHFVKSKGKNKVKFVDLDSPITKTVQKVMFSSETRSLEIEFDETIDVSLAKSDDDKNIIQARFTFLSGEIKEDQSIEKKFTIKVSGKINDAPVNFVLEPNNPGRVFDGMGGNFRLQNEQTDPQVIGYNLENMRVSWGRVEMPWQLWQPEENVDPIVEAKAGRLHDKVRTAMEMAQRLAQKQMPVIVSDWYAPAWAIIGDPRNAWRRQPGGLRGYPLNQEKMEQICESIANYLLYLKQEYGVEAWAFSFNESDLGINVRQTGEEHADFIKKLGQKLVDKKLATRLLLGDTSDANPVKFIDPALNDPETWPFICGVSFHSWRGCSDKNLTIWRQGAEQLNVPLLVGEGSTDAAAHRYPDIFMESTFAFYEINLYTRICAIAQPKSIIQWQLTADYSLLGGGGIWRNDNPLFPTQRFWNIKQLASSPVGAFTLPLNHDGLKINSVAFGDIANSKYALHIVNNGAKRSAHITGIPENVSEFTVYVTDSEKSMERFSTAKVENGVVNIIMPAASFISLMNY